MFLSTSFFAKAFDSFSIVKIYCGGMAQRYPGGVDRLRQSRWVFSSVPVSRTRRPCDRGAPRPVPARCMDQARTLQERSEKVESIPHALKRPVPRPLPVALKSRAQSGSLTHDQTRRSGIHSPNVLNPCRGSSVGQSGGLIIRRSGVRVPTPVLPVPALTSSSGNTLEQSGGELPRLPIPQVSASFRIDPRGDGRAVGAKVF